MLPILPLIIGAAAGAAATQLVRTKAVQQGLKKAGSQIRQAGDTLKQKASDGLDTVRETGAEMRRKVADKLHRRSAAHAGDADSAYEDASALLLPAPHEEAPAPKKASRSATGTRRRAARSASTSQPQEHPSHHDDARGFRGDASTAPSPPQASSDPQDRAGRGLRHAFDRIRVE